MNKPVSNIYARIKNWKFILLAFAGIIGFSSLFITNKLVKELKEEEKKKIELWADATKETISNPNPLSMKIIRENTSIPVILVDKNDSILEYRNFKNSSRLNSTLIKLGIIKEEKINKNYLKKELKKIKSNTEAPIEIKIPEYVDPVTLDLIPANQQRIYYKDSDLLIRLKYYPIYQLFFIAIFMIIAYLIFSASRKSEQNQVWAGMAKETAHQIGTPLSSLMACLEILKESKIEVSITNEMQKDIDRLERITDRFSKIGSLSNLEKTNVSLVIKNAIEYLKTRVSNNTNFIINIENDQVFVPLNTVLFEWVIENLIKNSVDAIKGSGDVVISLLDKKNNIEIKIQDNGLGIDKSIIKNIFKPGVTSKKRGWGLGLSLSKRIIEQFHKGKIFVVSSEKGKGAIFCIILPKY